MDPATGTFTTMDTYGGSLSDPMSLHKYLFANSNPVMYSDPSGHFCLAEMDAVMAIDCMLNSAYISGFLYIVDASITDPELEHHDIMGYFGALSFGFLFSGLTIALSSFTTGALILAVINTFFASMGVAKGIQDFDNGHVVYGPLEVVVSVVGCAIGWKNFADAWSVQTTSELIHVKGRGTSSDDAYVDYIGKEIDVWYEEQSTKKLFMTGNDGEAELARLVGGKSQQYRRTTLGGRFIDQLSPDNVAHESKVGYTTLTKFIKTQILKDAELIRNGNISGAYWHFFTSGVTGKGGASQPLLDFLSDHGISYTVPEN